MGAAGILGNVLLHSGSARASNEGADRKMAKIHVITTEEAMIIPEIIEANIRYLEKYPDRETGARVLATGFGAELMKRWRKELVDIGEGRIAAMDRDGIDTQLLSLTAPGVQLLDADEAVPLAALVNDRLSAAVKAYPGRFEALAAVAPQAPDIAARELERAIKTLGLKGALINSHTRGEYMDDQKFWPIFEALEALDVPLYLHPRDPSEKMVAPYIPALLLGPAWGFAAEAGLHALRLIFSGVFDRFPNLRIVLGHLGEGIPFYLSRLDKRYIEDECPTRVKLKQMPSAYFRQNFVVTTTGVNWAPAVLFCQEVLGEDKVLFGADHPYEDQKEALDLVKQIPMADETRALLYGGNARRVFKI